MVWVTSSQSGWVSEWVRRWASEKIGEWASEWVSGREGRRASERAGFNDISVWNVNLVLSDITHLWRCTVVYTAGQF